MKTVAEELREAFLRGERVIGSEFAARIGVSKQALFTAMKQFGDIVRSKPVRVNRYAQSLLWECVDVNAMRAWKPKEKAAPARRRGMAPRSGPWRDLMAAWNIRAADIELPSVRHRMSTEDDE